MATDSSFPSVRRDALEAARNVLRNTFGHVDFRVSLLKTPNR